MSTLGKRGKAAGEWGKHNQSLSLSLKELYTHAEKSTNRPREKRGGEVARANLLSLQKKKKRFNNYRLG